MDGTADGEFLNRLDRRLREVSRRVSELPPGLEPGDLSTVGDGMRDVLAAFEEIRILLGNLWREVHHARSEVLDHLADQTQALGQLRTIVEAGAAQIHTLCDVRQEGVTDRDALSVT